jgi:Protein of unknown function (DUF1236)
MRKKLLATVAVAAAVGLGGIAAAQSQMGGESNKSGAPSGASQEKSGGSMSGTQSGGGQKLNPSSNPSSSQSSNPSKNESAQGMQKGGKENERLRQGQTEQKGMSRGAQGEKGAAEQKGAQQERGKNLKGAQEERGERGKNLKGAQQERGERGKELKGAQEQRGTSTNRSQDERGTNLKGAEEQRGGNVKGTEQQGGTMGGNATVGERGERGRSVQLSEDQRSQVKTIVSRGNAPRFNGNVDFDVRVGTRIPRTVHFTALPEDIVRIVPEYRGFDYVLIRDEILIIDPDTLEIVAIIPA